METQPGGTQYWNMIRSYIGRITNTKRIINLCFQFIYQFRNHIYYRHNNLGLGKFEYTGSISNIIVLTEQLTNIKTLLSSQNILFISQKANICQLIELYLGILFLIEKYGGPDCGICQLYVILYREIIQLFKTIQHDKPIRNISRPKLESNGRLQPRLSSSLPEKISLLSSSISSESSETSTVSWSNSTGTIGFSVDREQKQSEVGLEFNVNGTINPATSQTLGQDLETSLTGTSSSSSLDVITKLPWKRVIPSIPASTTINPALISNLVNILPINQLGNLGWLTQVIRPLEVNIFLETEPGVFIDIYGTFLDIGLDKLIKNAQLCSINKNVSNTYKSLLAGLNCNEPVTFLEITNPGIIAGIKNYNNIHNNLLHVIQHISTDPGTSIWIIINGYIDNLDSSICNMYRSHSILSPTPFSLDGTMVSEQKAGMGSNLTKRRWIWHQQEFTKRWTGICNNISSIPDISMIFKLNYIKMVSLTHILTGATITILKQLYDCWNLYGLLTEMPIQDMLGLFNNSNITKKCDILTALLLANTPEAIFRAELLWNTLAHDLNGIDNTVYNQLHYTIQHKLSRHVTAPIINTGLSNDTSVEPELTYEHRISISLADKTTKARMLDKLKEINNKSNDNTSKATQYLEGLLSIPFGKYRKEAIITKNDNFIAKIKLFITNLIIMCLDTHIDYACCKEYLSYICTGLSLDINNIIALAQLDELAQEQAIQELIKDKSIKVSLLDNLANELSRILKQYMPVCPTQIDSSFLKSLLDGLEQQQLIQLYLYIFSSSNKVSKTNKIKTITPAFLLAYTENDHYAKEAMIEHLASEGHFYDVGYPPSIFNKYHTILLEYQQTYTELIQHKRTYLANCYSALDKSIYGQDDAKEQIIRIIGQWLNGNIGGYCLGFEGSPGVGKTSLAKYGIANALVDDNGNVRPFGFIALGGSSNGSTLEGHSYTYVGSTWGRIVDILINAECMNPIIFIDELDKISNTDNGRELIGILTHLTDKTQNNEFMDKYFAGVKIDLSKVLFIFSYNDYDKLDPILADRIHRIQFDNYTTLDKVAIAERYLIPKITAEINFLDLDIYFSPGTISYLINTYTYEAGVRKLKELLYDILRDINIRNIRGNLNTLELENNNTSSHKFNITPNIIDNILIGSLHKVDIPRPFDQPRTGVVYGLYATSMGIGGITIIQVCKKYTDTGNTLLCTGKQGDVMHESIKVSLTLAINILPKSIRDTLISGQLNGTEQLLKNYSFHIHCPDGSTPKDGPSAGCAFTVGIISILTDIPVLNNVSMTGEIDIMGRVLPIGGLDSKIQGSAKSGINKILVPADNKRDIDRIRLKQPEILYNITICFVDNILDVLRHSLVDAGLFI